MSLTAAELPGWIEFHAWRTGLQPHRISVSDGGSEVRATLYLDRRGRVRAPHLAGYIPVVFDTQRSRSSSRTATWLRLAAPLVAEMYQRRVPNLIYLPPEVDDVRPWQWQGFLTGVEYAYSLDLPFDATLMDRNHRSSCERASKLGLTVERVGNADPVIECLEESASRVGYSLRIRHRELRTAQSLLGDSLRTYVCFDPDGRPASSCAVVHVPNNVAIGWLFGTKSGRLGDGASHLLWRTVFDDLAASDATGLDFGGPNSPSSASFKSRWGCRLRPMHSIRSYSARAGARFLVNWLDQRRGSRNGWHPLANRR